MSETQDPAGRRNGLSRRPLLGLFGAGTARVLTAGAARRGAPPPRGLPVPCGGARAGVPPAGAAGGVIGHATAVDTAAASGPAPDHAVPFTGRHQAGIITPAQDRLHFVAFDVTTDSRDELVSV